MVEPRNAPMPGPEFAQASLLPPNRTPVEEALEQAVRSVDPDLSPIAALMDPATCPMHLLGWLAWSFSVDDWHDDWTDAIKRQVVADAIAVHRVKGTVGAVRRSLASLGFRAEIAEWFDYGGDPHTFRVDAFGDQIVAAGFQIDQTLLARVTRLIENVKPARSHFRLRIGEGFNVTATGKAGLLQRHRHAQTLSPAPRVQEIDNRPVLKPGLRQRSQHCQMLMPSPRPHEFRPAAVAKIGQRQRQRHGTTLTIIPRGGAAYAN